jgi:hypothetical protein
VARVVAVATDLLLGSKVEAMLSAAGHEVTLAPSFQEASWNGAELVVADLETENPETLVGLGIPVLGYYSHVDVETRNTAEAAGIDLAVPRSRLVRELPQLVERLLSERPR